MSLQLFRKKAIEQLASPDQLDQLMEVTTTRGWLALLALGMILLSALLWSFFGSVPTRVTAEGIILFRQGMLAIPAESPGRIRSITVQEGQNIAKGQIIATIYSQALEKKIEELTFKLDVFRKNFEENLADDRIALKSSQELVKNQQATMERAIQNKMSHVTWLRQKRANQDELLMDQLITRQTLNSTKEEILVAENEIKQMGDEIRKLNLEAIERQSGLDEKIRQSQVDIRQMENELNLANQEMRNLTVITSPISGRILKVEAKTGTYVNPGDRIVMLEADRSVKTQQEEVYDAVVYTQAAEGKRIKPGMEVQVIPTTVKAEKYGVMIGRVVSVSDFPVSRYAMLNVLENPELVEAYLKRGAPIEVWIDLLSDPRNPSGFHWSSPKGPPEKIYPGTLCAANVVVMRQAPISLIIPMLRETVFGEEGMRSD